MKKFIKELINSGYREHKPNGVIKPNCSKFFQKKIFDEIGIKYFINFYYYESKTINGIDIPYGFEVDMQFVKLFKDNEYTINYSIFGIYNVINGVKSMYELKEIEEFIEDCFKKQNFEYYEL